LQVLAGQTAGGVITGVDYHDGRGLMPLPQFVSDPATKVHSYTRYSCPETNVDYQGNDNVKMSHIGTWQECGAICIFSTACKFWTWSSSHRCYLKHSDKGVEFQADTISGQRGCM